jgi:hypothetical protein
MADAVRRVLDVMMTRLDIVVGEPAGRLVSNVTAEDIPGAQEFL